MVLADRVHQAVNFEPVRHERIVPQEIAPKGMDRRGRPQRSTGMARIGVTARVQGQSTDRGDRELINRLDFAIGSKGTRKGHRTERSADWNRTHCTRNATAEPIAPALTPGCSRFRRPRACVRASVSWMRQFSETAARGALLGRNGILPRSLQRILSSSNGTPPRGWSETGQCAIIPRARSCFRGHPGNW